MAQQARTGSVLLLAATCLVACSEDEDDEAASSSASGGSTATITINAPADGANVIAELEMDGDEVELEVEIEFTVTNFTLKEPGTCGGAAACGHVHIKVDGDNCDDTEEDGTMLPFNEEVFVSPSGADLLYCGGVSLGPDGVEGADGGHTITVQLHNDDESAVTNTIGVIVSDQVNVEVEVEDGVGTGGEGGAGGAGSGGRSAAGGAGGGVGGSGGVTGSGGVAGSGGA